MTTAISIQNVSKAYRLGVIGHGILREDLQSWWAKVRGKEDNNKIIGSQDDNEGKHAVGIEGRQLRRGAGKQFENHQANGAVKSTLQKILSRVTAQMPLCLHGI